MRLIIKIALILLLVLLLAYFLGPKASYDTVDATPLKLTLSTDNVESYIAKKEASDKDIKPGCQAEVLWATGEKVKTDYAVVYLHGFTASSKEGSPIIENFSTRYGFNLYKSRLAKHGVADIDAMKDLTPSDLIDSAKEALAIGKTLGKKLIVISTSTGSTLSSYLAATDPSIAIQIMLSPNFDLYDQDAYKTLKPWGKQFFKQAMGGNYRTWEATDKVKQFWQTSARIEGYQAMIALVQQTMTPEIWAQNNTPTFIGYYYKDEDNKDTVISIDAIKQYAQLAKKANKPMKVVPFASATNHVIGSSYMNKKWVDVQKAIYSFTDDVLKLEPKNSLVVTIPE